MFQKYRIEKKIQKINKLESFMSGLTDAELKDKTAEYKMRYQRGESLDILLPEAFALVREASKRVLGYGHYDVQLAGGIALHEGYIAEMKTGEGKTLVSTAPAYLNALTGRGVHIVTVNDYLASRDAEWMGQIHRLLGLTVGCVLQEMTPEARREAYACDITYVTNNELGFDYLRDNMAITRNDMVLRGLAYCIIDEADSVLIDEARTPLIISGTGDKVTKLYHLCDVLSRQMKRGKNIKQFSRADAYNGELEEETGDFIIDEDNQTAVLTGYGVEKVERFFGIDNISDLKNTDIRHHIILALRANYLMFKDIDYIVSEGEVKIVDEFTGRIMEGRRYSDGLHQAIEAKEHVEIQSENRTMAMITLQNFFNKYEKKSGMTGTAMSERREFRETYGMDVLQIPTNKPVLRQDRIDFVYKTKKEKYNSIIREILEANAIGQPVLVGTTSIETSEILSGLLAEKKIMHQVLNAKYDKEEADIVAKAGILGTVTIATNMAGRGTDIKLTEESKAVGGLKVIGTERHESRRIDDQLRGRSGRQGDPGDSRFFLSLEDDLLQYYGSESMLTMFENMKIEDGCPITHKKLTSFVEKAQKTVEYDNYGTRESLLHYDTIGNSHREIVYKKRLDIMDTLNIHNEIENMIELVITRKANAIIQAQKEIDHEKLNLVLERFIGFEIDKKDCAKKNTLLTQELSLAAVTRYNEKMQEIGNPERFFVMERNVYLHIIDRKWEQHLEDLEKLRDVIGYQSIGQKDPIVEYRLESAAMFNEMNRAVEDSTVETLFGLVFQR